VELLRVALLDRQEFGVRPLQHRVCDKRNRVSYQLTSDKGEVTLMDTKLAREACQV
jgi:hypothetical protein